MTGVRADRLRQATSVFLIAWGLSVGALLIVLVGSALGHSDPRADPLVRSLGLTHLALEPSGAESRSPGAPSGGSLQ